MIPKLQLALDMTDLDQSLDIANLCSDNIDIIEVGTILAIESGLNSVRKIKEKLPNSIVLADIRIIKAGGKLAEMAYKSGADIVTLISDATDETFEAVVNMKQQYQNRDVLIEINDSYTDEDLKRWKRYNLMNLIFHRGSEITASHSEWDKSHFKEIKRLNKMGFRIYVTGGIGIEEISLFKDTPVECFIIGRTITNSSDPKKTSKEFKNEIRKCFR